jgi:hypothetical protein
MDFFEPKQTEFQKKMKIPVLIIFFGFIAWAIWYENRDQCDIKDGVRLFRVECVDLDSDNKWVLLLPVEFKHCAVKTIQFPQGRSLTTEDFEAQMQEEGEDIIEVYSRKNMVYRVFIK